MNYDLLVDKIMAYMTTASYEGEAQKAKAEFFEAVGVFDEDSPLFEMKMSQFVDWYLFNRPHSESQQSLTEIACEEMDFTEEEKANCQNICNTKHSLFELIKIKGNDVTIRDLFSGYKFTVKDSNITLGFEKEQLFEARLVPHDDSFVFLKSFCFHPEESSKFILKEIKKLKKAPEDEKDNARSELMWRLLVMRHKLEQYRHLGVDKIYTNDSQLRSPNAKKK